MLQESKHRRSCCSWWIHVHCRLAGASWKVWKGSMNIGHADSPTCKSSCKHPSYPSQGLEHMKHRTSNRVKHVLYASTLGPDDLRCKTLQGNACMQYGVVQPLPSALQTFSLVWHPELGCRNYFVAGCFGRKHWCGIWQSSVSTKGLLVPQEMRGSLSTGFWKKSHVSLSNAWMPENAAVMDWSELIERMEIRVDLLFMIGDNFNMYKHLNIYIMHMYKHLNIYTCVFNLIMPVAFCLRVSSFFSGLVRSEWGACSCAPGSATRTRSYVEALGPGTFAHFSRVAHGIVGPGAPGSAGRGLVGLWVLDLWFGVDYLELIWVWKCLEASLASRRMQVDKPAIWSSQKRSHVRRTRPRHA